MSAAIPRSRIGRSSGSGPAGSRTRLSYTSHSTPSLNTTTSIPSSSSSNQVSSITPCSPLQPTPPATSWRPTRIQMVQGTAPAFTASHRTATSPSSNHHNTTTIRSSGARRIGSHQGLMVVEEPTNRLRVTQSSADLELVDDTDNGATPVSPSQHPHHQIYAALLHEEREDRRLTADKLWQRMKRAEDTARREAERRVEETHRANLYELVALLREEEGGRLAIQSTERGEMVELVWWCFSKLPLASASSPPPSPTTNVPPSRPSAAAPSRGKRTTPTAPRSAGGAVRFANDSSSSSSSLGGSVRTPTKPAATGTTTSSSGSGGGATTTAGSPVASRRSRGGKSRKGGGGPSIPASPTSVVTVAYDSDLLRALQTAERRILYLQREIARREEEEEAASASALQGGWEEDADGSHSPNILVFKEEDDDEDEDDRSSNHPPRENREDGADSPFSYRQRTGSLSSGRLVVPSRGSRSSRGVGGPGLTGELAEPYRPLTSHIRVLPRGCPLPKV